MKSEITKDLRARIVRTFMDMIFLAELQKKTMSGYDLREFLQQRFGIATSSGTIYSILYSLERDGLVNAEKDNRKRLYTLTENGEKTLQTVREASNEIHNLLHNLIIP